MSKNTWLYLAAFKINREAAGMPAMSAKTRDDLIAFFREELLRPVSSLDLMIITLPGVPPFLCSLDRCGHTALTATWSPFGQPSAVTAILMGIDPADDAAAIKRADYLLSLDTIGASIGQRTGNDRPLTATFCADEATYDGHAVRLCASTLSRAFMGQFAVE